MAVLGVPRPKRLEGRYEALAGDYNERRFRYLLRRHLGVEPEDVPALPWWKRRLYVEGLTWEFGDGEQTEYVDNSLDGLGSLGLSVSAAPVAAS